MKKALSAVLAVCMLVSQFYTLIGITGEALADGAQIPQYDETLTDHSAGSASFAAAWTNASYNALEKTVSGNTAAAGGNRNSISELYYPGIDDEDTVYCVDYTVEVPVDAVSLEGWGGVSNHSLDVIIGAAGEYAYKLRMRLDGSADFLLGYSNDSVTRAKLGKLLSNHRMMGIGVETGSYCQALGLKDIIRTEGSSYIIHFVIRLDVAGQTVSVWANDVKVFEDADVKGSLGAADYGKVTPAFGFCIESNSADNILNPIIRVGHVWGTAKEPEKPVYTDDRYDYSGEMFLKPAWVRTASFDSGSKTVDLFQPDSTNPQSYSELYVSHLSELKTVYADVTVKLPAAEVSFDNSHDQSFQLLVGKAADGYLYKINMRLYCKDILMGYATGTGSVASLCELAGAYFAGTSTNPLCQYVGLDTLAVSDGEFLTYNVTYALDTTAQTLSVWINGKLIASKISLTDGYSHGDVVPVLGLYAVNSNITAHSTARIDHIWSDDEDPAGSGSVTPTVPAFFSDGGSAYDSGTVLLNKDGVRGTLQSDAVFFDGLEFSDKDHYEISADILVLDHFNGSPINSNAPGLISVVFAERDNASSVLEAAIRPSINGQFGIIQTQPVRRGARLFAGFTNNKEHGQPTMLVSSDLFRSEKFRVTETEGSFSYPSETTFRVVYDHGKVTVTAGDEILLFRDEIDPDLDGGAFVPAVGFAAYNYKVRISNIRVSGAKQTEAGDTQDDQSDATLLSDADFDPDRIVASIGVLSDSHSSYSYFGEEEISTSARNFIDAIYNVNAASGSGLDAIMMTGDYTSTGTVNQAATFMNILGEGVRSFFDGYQPKISLAYGNHDTDWGNSLEPGDWDRMLKNGLVSIGGDGWRIAESGETADIPGLPGFRTGDSAYNSDAPAGCYDTVVEKTVDGRTYTYHLINIETDTYYFNSVTNIFTLDVMNWLDRTLKAITDNEPGQYVYVGMHAPIKESEIYATQMWADTNANWGTSKASIRGMSGNIDDILRKYPQAVVFSGHTHYADLLETCIMQKNYTAVNVPPASMAGTLNASKNHPEGNNDGSAKGMALLVELDADGNQRITRIDLNKTPNHADTELALKKVKNQSTASGEKDYPEIYAVESIKATAPSGDTGYHGEVSTRWTTPAPRADKSHLDYYSKARGASNTVAFPEGSALKCETAGLTPSSSMFNIEFPAAISSDPAVAVLHYRIQAFDKKTGEELLIRHSNVTNTTLKEIWTYGNWNPVRMGAANGTNHLDATQYAYDNLRIDTTDDVTVSVIPVDEYGHEGAALTADFSPFIEAPSTDGENLAPKTVLVDMNRRTVSKWTDCSYTLEGSNTERIRLKGLRPGDDYVFAAKASIKDNKDLNVDGNEINWEGLIFQVATATDGNGDPVTVEARMRTSAIVIMYVRPDGSEVYLTQTPFNNPFDETAEYVVHYHGGKVDLFRNGEGVMCNFDPKRFGLSDTAPCLGFGGEVTSYSLSDVRIVSEGFSPDPAVPGKPAGNGNYISYVTETFSGDVLAYDGRSVRSFGDAEAQYFEMPELPFKPGESYVFDFDLTVDTAAETWMGGRLFFGSDEDGKRYGVLFTQDAIMISYGDDIIYHTPFPRTFGKTYHADVFVNDGEVSVWVDDVLFADAIFCERLEKTVNTLLFEYCRGAFADLDLYYTDPVKYTAPDITVIEAPSTDGENLAPKAVFVDMDRRTVSKWTSRSYSSESSNTERIRIRGFEPGDEYIFAAKGLVKDNKGMNVDGNEIDWEGLIFQVATALDESGNKVIVEARMRNSALVIMYVLPDGSEVYLTQVPKSSPFGETAEYIVHYRYGKIDIFRNGEGVMCNLDPGRFGLTDVAPYLGFGGEVAAYSLSDVRIVSENYRPEPAVPAKPDGNGNYISYVTGVVSSNVLTYDGKTVRALTDSEAQTFDMPTLPFKAGESYVFDFDLTAETAAKEWMGGRLFFGTDDAGRKYGVLFTQDAIMVSYGDDIIYQTPFPRNLGKTNHMDVFVNGKEVSVWADGILFADAVRCEHLSKAVNTILFEYCKGEFANLDLYYTDPVKYEAPHVPVLRRLAEGQYNAAEWMKVTAGKEPLRSYYGNRLSSDDPGEGVYYYFDDLPVNDGMSYYYGGRFTAFESSETWKLPRFIFRESDGRLVYLAFTRESALIMCGNDVLHSVPASIELGRQYDVVILSEPDRVSVWLDNRLIMSDIGLDSLGKLEARLGLWFEMCRAQVTDLSIYGDEVKLDPSLVNMELYNDEFYRMKGIPEPADRLNLFQNITMYDFSNGALGSEFDGRTRTLRTQYAQGSGNIRFTDALGSENINGLRNGSGHVFRFKYTVNDWKADVPGNSGISLTVNNSRHLSYSGRDMYYNVISISGDSLVMQSFQRGQNRAYSIVPFARENGRTYDVAIVHGATWIKLFVDGEVRIVMTDLPAYNIAFEATIQNAATMMGDIQVYEFKDSGLTILEPEKPPEKSKAGNTIYDAQEREQEAASSDLTGRIALVAGPAVGLCALVAGGAAFAGSRRRRKAS